MKRNLKFEDVPGRADQESLKEKLAKIGIGSVNAGAGAFGTDGLPPELVDGSLDFGLNSADDSNELITNAMMRRGDQVRPKIRTLNGKFDLRNIKANPYYHDRDIELPRSRR